MNSFDVVYPEKLLMKVTTSEATQSGHGLSFLSKFVSFFVQITTSSFMASILGHSAILKLAGRVDKLQR